MSIEEIAERRFLSPTTVLTHLAKLYEEGEDIDIHQFISAKDIQTITKALPKFEEPYKLRDIYDYFADTFPFDQLRLAIAFHNKNKQQV